MKKATLTRVPLYLLLALLMPLVVVLSSTLYFAFSDSFYLNFFDKAGTAAQLGLTQEGMTEVVGSMTAYLSGAAAGMDLQVPVHGELMRFYNDKELAHMVDVRDLMAWGQSLRTGLLIACLVALGILRRIGGMGAFWRGLLAGALGALGFAGILGILAATDFYGAFYHFHILFFTNDLWLLDPATDRLIQMLPEAFFFSITTRIVLVSAIGVIALGSLACWGIRREGLIGKEVDRADHL